MQIFKNVIAEGLCQLKQLYSHLFSHKQTISAKIFAPASSPIQHIRSQPRLAVLKDQHLTLHHLLAQRRVTFGPGLLQNKCILIWNIRSRTLIKRITRVLYTLLSHTPSGCTTSCIVLRYWILQWYETRKLLMNYLHRDFKKWNNVLKQ